MNWSAERWTRGCYVGYTPPGVLTDYGPWIRRPFGRIHWAGAETSDYWNGYMDGAVRSGERAAPRGAGRDLAGLRKRSARGDRVCSAPGFRRECSHVSPPRRRGVDRSCRLAEPDDDRAGAVSRLGQARAKAGDRVHVRGVLRVPARRDGDRARTRPAAARARAAPRLRGQARDRDHRRRGDVGRGRAAVASTAIDWQTESSPRSIPKGKSSAILGATIRAVELPTAFPYFAAIAAIVGSGLDPAKQFFLLRGVQRLLRRARCSGSSPRCGSPAVTPSGC